MSSNNTPEERQTYLQSSVQDGNGKVCIWFGTQPKSELWIHFCSRFVKTEKQKYYIRCEQFCGNRSVNGPKKPHAVPKTGTTLLVAAIFFLFWKQKPRKSNCPILYSFSFQKELCMLMKDEKYN